MGASGRDPIGERRNWFGVWHHRRPQHGRGRQDHLTRRSCQQSEFHHLKAFCFIAVAVEADTSRYWS